MYSININFWQNLFGGKKSANEVTPLLSNALNLVGETFSDALWKEAGFFDTIISAVKPILSGEPTGEWHLVIGNPYNPIEMIGNLACESFNFSFNDELGYDDFPTELKFEVTLVTCMARDRGGVESIFNYS